MLGREVRSGVITFDGRLTLIDVEYDLLGRVKRKSEPYFDGGGPQYWTENSFDILGRPTQSVHADGSTDTLSYAGFSTTATNALGQQKTEKKNAFGELVMVSDAAAYVGYLYNAVGNLLTTSQGDPAVGSASVTIQYDPLGRKIQMSDPDMGSLSYAYNAFGELTVQTNAAGHYQVQSYDLLGRMKQRIDYRVGGVLERTSLWAYDTNSGTNPDCPLHPSPPALYGAPGALCHERIMDAGGATLQSRTYSDDGFARPITVATVIGSTGYSERTTYDEVGRVFQQFDAAGANRGTEARYTPYGHLEKVVEAQDSLHTEKIYSQILSVDARGNVLQSRTGPHTKINTYDPATGRLLTSKVTLANFVLMQDLAYTWDVVGNLTQRKDTSRKPDGTAVASPAGAWAG